MSISRFICGRLDRAPSTLRNGTDPRDGNFINFHDDTIPLLWSQQDTNGIKKINKTVLSKLN